MNLKSINMGKQKESTPEDVFDMQLDEGVVECGRLGISFERTYAVYCLKLDPESIVPSPEIAVSRKEHVRKLWEKGQEMRNVRVAQKLHSRFESNTSGSYADLEAHRRQQEVEEEIRKQFGD